MTDFKLSITICSWNTIDDLRACLKSLEEVRNEGPFEVIVYDNNWRMTPPIWWNASFPG